MSDYVVGYNRSIINKEEVSHGYSLLNRYYSILDYLIALLLFLELSIIIIIFNRLTDDMKLIIGTVNVSIMIIYGIYRINNVLFTKRIINNQFLLYDDLTLYYTFYNKMMDISVSVTEGKKNYTVLYENFKRICYDKDIIIIQLKNGRTAWLKPIFLKNIDLNQLIQLIKLQNKKLSVSGVI